MGHSGANRAQTWITRKGLGGRLASLVETQNADGSWDPELNGQLGREGSTALAMLPFLTAGLGALTVDGEDRIGSCLRRGLTFLIKAQTVDGRIGGVERPVDHALATCALLERERCQTGWVLLESIQRALDFLVLSDERSPFPTGDAWRAHALRFDSSDLDYAKCLPIRRHSRLAANGWPEILSTYLENGDWERLYFALDQFDGKDPKIRTWIRDAIPRLEGMAFKGLSETALSSLVLVEMYRSPAPVNPGPQPSFVIVEEIHVKHSGLGCDCSNLIGRASAGEPLIRIGGWRRILRIVDLEFEHAGRDDLPRSELDKEFGDLAFSIQVGQLGILCGDFECVIMRRLE
jgi:hypothetical protein